MRFPPIIGVIGAGHATPDILEMAEAVGREIALAGAWLVCGGLGGVMEAASRGAKAAGGFTIGILPGRNREDASPYIDVPIVTGLGEGRNLLVVYNAQVVIAVGGEWGTLSEIALARKTGKPVVALHSWELRFPNGREADVLRAETPADAVRLALQQISASDQA